MPLRPIFAIRRKEPAIRKGEGRPVGTEAEIEGRIFRLDVPYLLPKDMKEMSRLDFQHYGLMLLLEKLYEASLDPSSLHRVLDVGFGTGRWVQEIALEMPHTRVVGIDIKSQLASIEIPSNTQLLLHDVLQRFPFQDNFFDYVHQRLLVGGIPTTAWSHVLQEEIRVTRPGGWIELLEAGNHFQQAGPATTQFTDWWNAASRKTGFDLSVIPNLDILLSQYGLQNVHKKTIQIPLGPWAGRAGMLLGNDIYAVFKGLRAFYIQKLGMPPMLYEQLLEQLPNEWQHFHTTYEFYSFSAQKKG